MIRILLAATLLAAPAVPALAQATHHEAAGAVSGRSPHRAYREIARADRPCRSVAIAVPAGKLPHYGTHATADCPPADTLAQAGGDRRTARD